MGQIIRLIQSRNGKLMRRNSRMRVCYPVNVMGFEPKVLNAKEKRKVRGLNIKFLMIALGRNLFMSGTPKGVCVCVCVCV